MHSSAWLAGREEGRAPSSAQAPTAPSKGPLTLYNTLAATSPLEEQPVPDEIVETPASLHRSHRGGPSHPG
jgi:hypothetical protein